MIRPAATLCLLREGSAGLEVLMALRAAKAAFVGGGYVFPGGAVEPIDHEPLAAEVLAGAPTDEMVPWMAAALRETFEEVGVLLAVESVTADDVDGFKGLRGSELYERLSKGGVHLDASRLVYLSNWVGPPVAPRRFDTRFFLTEAPQGVLAEADGIEVTEAIWVKPELALERAESGDWPMLYPTRKHLEHLGRFPSPAAAVSHARHQSAVQRIEPQARVRPDGSYEILIPGEPPSDQVD